VLQAATSQGASASAASPSGQQEKKMKNRQRGISFITILFIAGILACGAVLGAQVLPTLIEFQAIVKAVNKAAAEGTTVPEVKAVFDKAASIDNIESISGKDLQVTKEGDKVVVSFAYNREIHMAGPAYLLLKYTGRSR